VTAELFIGMISGTSRDGVDAALVRFKDGLPEVLEAVCIPYPAEIADTLKKLIVTGKRPAREAMTALDDHLAAHFSRTALALLEKAGSDPHVISAIGSHGQTVWHDPEGPEPETIQLGDPGSIARQTGIVTVGDFRRADMEAGGQGAPLAPLLHRALFYSAGDSRPAARVVLNLGGIANISVIGDSGSVSGFDTGPANCLMDGWIQEHRSEPFDRDGGWAANGSTMPVLLERMLADPYFQKAAPKSTGVEYFNASWLRRHLQNDSPEPVDVQATLAELTAVSIANSIRPFAPDDVLLCGGGTHNAYVVQRLKALLPGITVRSTADFGLDPDWIEAILFAWLARERLAGRPLDTRSITGASRPVLLGNIAGPS
jgi:anhydro-N-acetylmuramic acid kinase